MITQLDLAPAHLEVARRLLAAHVPGVEVWAYGSRVKGTNHEGSDLDLVLRDPADLPVEHRRLLTLRSAFAESDLPILVDVLDWPRLPKDFRNDIEGAHVVLQGPPAPAFANPKCFESVAPPSRESS